MKKCKKCDIEKIYEDFSNNKNEEELFKLNHYTNLQPLWAEDNIKKNRKL